MDWSEPGGKATLTYRPTRVEHTNRPCRHCAQPLDYLPDLDMWQHTVMRYDCQCGKAEPEVL